MPVDKYIHLYFDLVQFQSSTSNKKWINLPEWGDCLQGFIYLFICFSPSRSTCNDELHSIYSLQCENWWESRKDTAGGGRLTAAKPRFGWLSLKWSLQHRWSCYLFLPHVAKLKLLKFLKINLMSEKLITSNMQCLSQGSQLVNLPFNAHAFVLSATRLCFVFWVGFFFSQFVCNLDDGAW